MGLILNAVFYRYRSIPDKGSTAGAHGSDCSVFVECSKPHKFYWCSKLQTSYKFPNNASGARYLLSWIEKTVSFISLLLLTSSMACCGPVVWSGTGY